MVSSSSQQFHILNSSHQILVLTSFAFLSERIHLYYQLLDVSCFVFIPALQSSFLVNSLCLCMSVSASCIPVLGCNECPEGLRAPWRLCEQHVNTIKGCSEAFRDPRTLPRFFGRSCFSLLLSSICCAGSTTSDLRLF